MTLRLDCAEVAMIDRFPTAASSQVVVDAAQHSFLGTTDSGLMSPTTHHAIPAQQLRVHLGDGEATQSQFHAIYFMLMYVLGCECEIRYENSGCIRQSTTTCVS